MKLFWSGRSPFARKAAVAIHELGLQDRVELIPALVTTGQNMDLLLRHNPLRKMPTLITDDGAVIYDSVVIIEYLDSLSGTPKLLAQTGAARWRDLSRQALADGMMDILLLWRGEFRRPEAHRQQNVLSTYDSRTRSGLDALEADVADTPFGVGDLSVGCLLSYLDFRYDIDWRAGRPALSRWYETISQRPSFLATEFSDAE